MIEPQVGMGATFVNGTDDSPGTIVEVQTFQSGARKGEIRRIGVREDKWTVVSGNEWDGTAEYRYRGDETAPVVWFMKNKDGRWASSKGQKVSIGERRRYYDPHF